MDLLIVEEWFVCKCIDDSVILVRELYVYFFLWCNIWYVCGCDCDLFIDIGMGISVLKVVVVDFFEKQISVVLIYVYVDYFGGVYEFDSCFVYEVEVVKIDSDIDLLFLDVCLWFVDVVEMLEVDGLIGDYVIMVRLVDSFDFIGYW